MEREKFDFFVMTDDGCMTESFYGTRHYADKHFDKLVAAAAPNVLGIYYYAASVPGLVNAYHRPGAVT